MDEWHEITLKIWSSPEVIIILFLGSAAEFPLVEENHWLFFTNSLPAHPQRRFVETIKYNQKAFRLKPSQMKIFGDHIRNIHTSVEQRRERAEGGHPKISNEAFKFVGSMIIDYGIKGYEYINKIKLSDIEKEEFYQDSLLYITSMHVKDMEPDYKTFIKDRMKGFKDELTVNPYTKKMLEAYKEDVGSFRYWVVAQSMAHFAYPQIVKKLGLKKNLFFTILYKIYPYLRNQFLFKLLESAMLKKDTRKVLDRIEANPHAFH